MARDIAGVVPRGRRRDKQQWAARVAYDGRHFHGVQQQPGLPTVLGALRARLARHGITEAWALSAAARTDAGVHARENLVSWRQYPGATLTADADADTAEAEAADNADESENADTDADGNSDAGGNSDTDADGNSDADIDGNSDADADDNQNTDTAADGSSDADTHAHHHDGLRLRAVTLLPRRAMARGMAAAKHYRYRITEPGGAPRRDAWNITAPLDVAAMRALARGLVGRHDFAALRASSCGQTSSVRELLALHIARTAPCEVTIDLYGDAFLRRMARVVVGTLVEVGLGCRAPDTASTLLAGSRAGAGATAPAHGLTLEALVLRRPWCALIGRAARDSTDSGANGGIGGDDDGGTGRGTGTLGTLLSNAGARLTCAADVDAPRAGP